MSKNKPVARIVDLFAGCGGITCGFRRAAQASPEIELKVVSGVEFDFSAAATYTANFGDHLYYGDITDWVEKMRSGEIEVPDAEIVVGGPPCQGFSKLGKQDPNDPRNSLWRAYVAVVSLIQPDYFVMENVPQFLTSGEFDAFAEETQEGQELNGYLLQHFVMAAHKHGTAQKRRRAIIIGRREGRAPVSKPEEQPEVALRQVLEGLAAHVPVEKTLPDTWSDFKGKRIRGPYETTEIHVQGPMSERMRQMVQNIPAGGNRFDLPRSLQYDCWLNGSYGGNDVMGRLNWDAPSVTIRTQFYKPDKGRYIHPDQDRAITYAEAAYIQGFPADFLWCGSAAQIAKQIGNAVPVPLAEAIGRSVIDAYLEGKAGEA